MEKYLWNVKYDALGLMRFNREKQVVTKNNSISDVEKTLISGFGEQERKEFDFITQVTFMAEVYSD